MPINDFASLIALDRRAVQSSLHALASWRPTDGDPGTPCAGWTLTDLLAHMTVQQNGFARAATGEHTTLGDWLPVKEQEPLDAYRQSCTRVLAAFKQLSDPSAPTYLPEIQQDALPAARVVGFHLVDNVVHAWDVARSLGADPVPDGPLLEAALTVAQAVPDDERRERDGAAFAHALPLPSEAPILDQILLLLGRDPTWPPERPATPGRTA